MKLGAIPETSPVQDRFNGKTWISWAKVVLSGPAGLFCAVNAVLFLCGLQTDANGQGAPLLAIPFGIMALVFLPIAAMGGANIVASRTPIIRCFREGIECNLVGNTSLDHVFGVPGIVRVAWKIYSLQGFRSSRVRIPWSQFRAADVAGITMAYRLGLHGLATNLRSGHTSEQIVFRQSDLTIHPNQIAEVINGFAANPAARDELPSWSI
jgi:hypothetical protein